MTEFSVAVDFVASISVPIHRTIDVVVQLQMYVWIPKTILIFVTHLSDPATLHQVLALRDENIAEMRIDECVPSSAELYFLDEVSAPASYTEIITHILHRAVRDCIDHSVGFYVDVDSEMKKEFFFLRI